MRASHGNYSPDDYSLRNAIRDNCTRDKYTRSNYSPLRRRAISRRSTLLDLVLQLQRDLTLSDEEVVGRAVRLVNSGRVVLTGNFAGQRLRTC
jgi:hypothetical protein